MCNCRLTWGFQKQSLEVFYKKGVLNHFAIFTRKRLCKSRFISKVVGLRPTTLLKKRLWHRCFPVNFAKFLRTLFLQNNSRCLFLDFNQKQIPIHMKRTEKVSANQARIFKLLWNCTKIIDKFWILALLQYATFILDFACITFLRQTLLTHFMPLVSFYTTWKRQKTYSFLMFSGGVERG